MPVKKSIYFGMYEKDYISIITNKQTLPLKRLLYNIKHFLSANEKTLNFHFLHNPIKTAKIAFR